MIKIDGSLVIQIFNFVFLIWALNIVLFKPIRGMLTTRREKVEGLEGQIDTFAKDAVDNDRAYAEGIKDARKKGLQQKEAMLQAATEEERKITAAIHEKAQEDLEALRASIARDVDSVRESLQQEVDDFADAICRKILGRAI